MTYQAGTRTDQRSQENARKMRRNETPEQAKAMFGGPATAGLHQLRAAAAARPTPLTALQAQARSQPAVQRVMQLQELADDQGAEERATIPSIMPDQRQAVAPGGGPGHRRHGLRSTTQLQRQTPSFGAVQYPALVGAPNTPIHSPFATQMGAVVTQMKRADYDAWQGTVMARTTPHGVMHQGDRSTVARWQSGAGVMQQISIPLTPKMKAGLVMAEASLTIIAGVAGLVAGTGFGAIPLVVPSILALITGVLKFGRGMLMYQTKAPEGKRLAAIDALRTIEALVAGVGALMADPTSFYKIPSMIFAVAKLVRSLATALADLIVEKKGNRPNWFVKGLRGLAAVAHAVEVATVGFSAGAGLAEGIMTIASGTETASGVAKAVAATTGLGIATAKDVRAADQTVAWRNMPDAAPEDAQAQGGARARASSVASLDAGGGGDESGGGDAVAPTLVASQDDAAPQPSAAPAQDNAAPQPGPASGQDAAAAAAAAVRAQNERTYAKQIEYGMRVADIYDWPDDVVYEMAIAGAFDDNVDAIENEGGPDPSYLT